MKTKTTKRRSLTRRVRPLESGVVLIAEERDRQKRVEGWTLEHDDKHLRKEMALAADSYLATHTHPPPGSKARTQYGPCWDWPWDLKWWKPSADPVRNLVKAGALIAAEIDRIQRKRAKRPIHACEIRKQNANSMTNEQ
jgi:hypothetical protein